MFFLLPRALCWIRIVIRFFSFETERRVKKNSQTDPTPIRHSFITRKCLLLIYETIFAFDRIKNDVEIFILVFKAFESTNRPRRRLRSKSFSCYYFRIISTHNWRQSRALIFILNGHSSTDSRHTQFVT